MKTTVPSNAEPGQQAASEQVRSRPAWQQAMAHGAPLAQLAAAVNASPQAKPLTQMKDSSQQSPRVQSLMGLAAEINQGALPQPASLWPAQLKPEFTDQEQFQLSQEPSGGLPLIAGKGFSHAQPAPLPVQRYIDRYATDNIYGDETLKNTLSALIAQYNEKDVAPLEGFYGERLQVTPKHLEDQLRLLSRMETAIAGANEETRLGNQFALQALTEQISHETSSLRDQKPIFELSDQLGISARLIYRIREDPDGLKFVNNVLVKDVLPAATESAAVKKIVKILLSDENLPLGSLAIIIPQVLENISLRKWLATRNPEDAAFKSENLIQFANSLDLLTVFFQHLIKVRNLTAEAFLSRRDKLAERLFKREIDYEAAAIELAMKLPKPVTLVELAAELTRNMQALGYRIFLAGGGAIRFRGGPRPIADLDFRMDPQQGLTSFSSFHGKEILKTVNRLLELSKVSREAGLSYSMFSAAGKKAMTIGTQNWFNVEISISINQAFQHEAPEPTELRFHSKEYVEKSRRERIEREKTKPAKSEKIKREKFEPEEEPTRTLNLLSFTDLLRDKLKTAITRTKEGEINYKKVAQDLFDILSIVVLLREKEHIDVLHPKSLAEHFSHRADQYKIQNLEPPGLDVTTFEIEKVVKMMVYRLVRTARSHLVEGPRRDEFLKLQSRSPLEVLDVLKELAGIDISGLLEQFGEFDIEGWFAKWNIEGASLEERTKRPAPNVDVERLSLSPVAPERFPGASLVAHILETAPATLDLANNTIRILYILYKSENYLRPLDNANEPLELIAAFSESISVRNFREFYNKYSNKEDQGKKEKQKEKEVPAEQEGPKYVQGEEEGLRLLPAGLEFIAEKVREASQ
jgi:hypothetical protein